MKLNGINGWHLWQKQYIKSAIIYSICGLLIGFSIVILSGTYSNMMRNVHFTAVLYAADYLNQKIDYEEGYTLDNKSTQLLRHSTQLSNNTFFLYPLHLIEVPDLMKVKLKEFYLEKYPLENVACLKTKMTEDGYLEITDLEKTIELRSTNVSTMSLGCSMKGKDWMLIHTHPSSEGNTKLGHKYNGYDTPYPSTDNRCIPSIIDGLFLKNNRIGAIICGNEQPKDITFYTWS